ncbi:MAG: short-chain dehydrogenase [Bradyrhizobium sp.]|nr:short-chain dehydrogenase [Bradyrhizobium sp.]
MKTALVTGANKGVGLATARALTRLGMKVWLAARSPERGRAAETILRGEGGDATFVHIDVADPASITDGVERITRENPVLDILINNAGIMRESLAREGERIKPSQVTSDILREVFETNVFGAIGMIRECLPLLLRAPAPRIVNVSSRLGSFALQTDENWPHRHVNQLGYSSSKAALNMATVMLAFELRGTPLKINAVSPGIIATDLNGMGAAALAGRSGYGTTEDGARLVVQCATLPDDGPSGSFFGPGGPIAW